MAGRSKKLVIRTKLGEREIARDSILYFPHGLIGLDDKREFVLIQVRENSPFLLLQCVTDPGLGLLVADPYPFLPDYNVKLEQPEKKLLRVENIRQMAVLVTVTIPKDRPEETTLNLSGPIILNTKARLGLQAPQVDAKHPTHYRLVEAQRAQKPTPE
ncbi:MAG: flagellar assembly protein FliW [Proteobacteria bacterium]|nr:flagellar assembly protein FliW [Pseudomonadota bacterium]MBU1594529.1 flagellar assembly protein FliW [Pseudomonadota bacterium]